MIHMASLYLFNTDVSYNYTFLKSFFATERHIVFLKYNVICDTGNCKVSNHLNAFIITIINL